MFDTIFSIVGIKKKGFTRVNFMTDSNIQNELNKAQTKLERYKDDNMLRVIKV